MTEQGQNEFEEITSQDDLQDEVSQESNEVSEPVDESVVLIDEPSDALESHSIGEAEENQKDGDAKKRVLTLFKGFSSFQKKALIKAGILVVAVSVGIAALVLLRTTPSERVEPWWNYFYATATGSITFYGPENYDPTGVVGDKCPNNLGQGETAKLALQTVLSGNIDVGAVTISEGLKVDANAMPGTEGCEAAIAISGRKWNSGYGYLIIDESGKGGFTFHAPNDNSGGSFTLTLKSGTPVKETAVTINLNIFEWNKEGTQGAKCRGSGIWADSATFSIIQDSDGATVQTVSLEEGLWADSDALRPGVETCIVSQKIEAPLIPNLSYSVLLPDGSLYPLLGSGMSANIGTGLPRFTQECGWIVGLGDPGRDLAWRIIGSSGSKADPANYVSCPEYIDTVNLAQRCIHGSGTYVVGQSVAPGTYQTKAGIKNCYWARLTGGGSIIDNDFVSFAAYGATVTILSSDAAFETDGCGSWLPI
jgi:hypothetical protein